VQRERSWNQIAVAGLDRCEKLTLRMGHRLTLPPGSAAHLDPGQSPNP
jgi:hypothetical protein